MEGKGSYLGPLPAITTAMVREEDRAAASPARGKGPRDVIVRARVKGLQRGCIGYRRAAARRSCALPTEGARAPARGPVIVPSPSSVGRHGCWLLLLSSLGGGVESRGEGEEKEVRKEEAPTGRSW
jgi:hypothetical protein